MAEPEEFPGPQDDDLDEILRSGKPGDKLPEELGGGLTSEIENLLPRELNEKPVTVVGVYEHQEEGMPPAAFVLLRDASARQVVIWIGRFEAYAISAALENALYDRPMTHDLLSIMVDRLGARVEKIIIDDLWQDTYYAKIMLINNKDESVQVDARPSDAIALALRAKAMIFMAESVLEQASANEQM